MSTTDVRDAEIADYLAAVRTALSDLDPVTRDGLLDDLPGHLAEVAANDPEPLPTRLGSPAVFAADLRSAAGIAPAAEPARRPDDPGQSSIELIRSVLATSDQSIGRMLGYDRAAIWLAELQPAWWIVRGVIIGGAAQVLFGVFALSLLLGIVTIVLSTRLGRRAKSASTSGSSVASLLFSAACTVMLFFGLLAAITNA